MSYLKQALLAADDARYAAMIEGNFAALESLLADELLYCHSSGQVDTRASYLAALQTGHVKYVEFQRFDEIVRPVGTVALLSGLHRLQVLVQGEEKVLHNRFTTTWLLRDARWVLLSWASTPVPAPR